MTNWEAVRSGISLDMYAELINGNEGCGGCPAKLFCKSEEANEYETCLETFIAWGRKEQN